MGGAMLSQSLIFKFPPLSLPSGSFHKLLILLHQKADRLKVTSQKTNQSDHMDHSLV